MRAQKHIYLFVAGVPIALLSHACLASDDGGFEYWSKAGIQSDIGEGWQFEFEEELKLGDDAGEFYCHNSDFGFVYKSFADWLDVAVKFKKEYEKDDAGHWRQENRPHLDLELKGGLSGLAVSDRSRLEYRDREIERDVWRYRNKFSVKFPVKFTALRLQPYVAEEVFINFDAEDFNQNRFYGGFYLFLAKAVRVDIFYLWRSDKSDGSWHDTNIVGTGIMFYF